MYKDINVIYTEYPISTSLKNTRLLCLESGTSESCPFTEVKLFLLVLGGECFPGAAFWVHGVPAGQITCARGWYPVNSGKLMKGEKFL